MIARHLVVLSASLLFATGLPQLAFSEDPAPPRTILRVALFPYIPDAGDDHYRRLSRLIETRFEEAYPEIDLRLRDVDPEDDFYDTGLLKTWLQDSDGDGYDVVEIDAVLLGELEDEGLIRPFEPQTDTRDWHPAARAAVSNGDVVLAIPHLLCAHYIISRVAEAADAADVRQVESALTADPGTMERLAGDLQGSWNLPSLYLDAWRDTYPDKDVAAALAPALDPKVRGALLRVKRLCDHADGNRCLDGSFHSPREDGPATLLASESVNAIFGYSERLFTVTTELRKLWARPGDLNRELRKLTIGPAALGFGNAPIVFVDAFVQRSGLAPAVGAAAQNFAEFMNRPELQGALLMSHDAPDAPPRYLLPATLSAFETPGLKQDRFYQILAESLENAAPFPTRGLPAIRKQLQAELLAALGEAIAGEPATAASSWSDQILDAFRQTPAIATGVLVTFAVGLLSIILSLLTLHTTRAGLRANVFRELRREFTPIRSRLPTAFWQLTKAQVDASKSTQRAIQRYWYHAFDEWYVTRELHPWIFRKLWRNYYSKAITKSATGEGMMHVLRSLVATPIIPIDEKFEQEVQELVKQSQRSQAHSRPRLWRRLLKRKP